ncbi:MAG: hypothetical protein ACM359_02245 [Bacillota bacterium]
MSLLNSAISLFCSSAARPPRAHGNAPHAVILASVVVLAVAAGCIGKKPANPAATQPVTNVPPEMAKPDYWLAQPATAEVTADNFDALWAASEAAAYKFMFPIDSRDYRHGLLKTEAVTSKQFFEFWRKDAGTATDVRENSLGPIRRTVYFQFTRNLDGTFTVTPKVVLERMSVIDPKYVLPTDATQGQSQSQSQSQAQGQALGMGLGQSQASTNDPRKYWYALRRDAALEAKIADTIQTKLRPQ